MTATTEEPVSDGERLSEPSMEDEPEVGSEETTAAEDRAVALGLNEVFEVLKNERRRMVIHYLSEHDEPVSLGDLAEHVAAIENDTTVAQVTSKQRKCSYVGLYQCHLPKMDDMDIIEFNQNRGRIASGPNADTVREYLDTSEGGSRAWPVYYGTVATAGVGMIVAVYFLTGPSVVGLGLSVALLASIAVLATAQLRADGADTAVGTPTE